MMTIILCIACFVLGDLKGQGKLNWVACAAGKARDAVFGSRPVAAPTVSEIDRVEVSPPPANKTIEPLKVIRNLIGFIWHWRHWIVAGLIALFAWTILAPVVSFVTCPFGGAGILWCAGDRATDRAALDNANTNTAVAEHETDVANRGAELAEESHHDALRRSEVIAQAEQEFADAVSQADFDRLHSAYERATAGVWDGLALESEPDHAAPRSDPVRRSGADSA